MAVFIPLYFVIHALFLTRFPFMHSDESWLSGLTRAMMHTGPGATEPFFDLLPRYPHAIKILFHSLQMPLIASLDYNLFAVRLLSLLGSCLALFLFYRMLLKITDRPTFSMLMTVLLSVDIQFIYASHFARQEIWMVVALLAGFYWIVHRQEQWRVRDDLIVGTIIGLSIGFHPNSFIVALAMGAVYVVQIIRRQFLFRHLLIVIGTTILWAALFVGLSYAMDPQFIPHYLTYGDNLGATQSGWLKVIQFPKFYARLWNRHSVTYYLPDIRLQLIMFTLAIIGSLIVGIRRKLAIPSLLILALAAIQLGILLIGRYGQPSIVLIFPLGYLLIACLLHRLWPRTGQGITMALCALMIVISTAHILPQLRYDYVDYQKQIQAHIPSDANVLANLNAEYAFDHGKLYDYRNLDYLDETGTAFADYIGQRDIQYIIYPDEMDVIYAQRPVYNVMYGNVYPYYEDMQDFLHTHCEVAARIPTLYAMRIASRMDERPWYVTLYRVLDEVSDD